MTEKELQKLFKDKLDNRSFEFNPRNWEAMEAMLNEKGKKRMGYYWRSATVIMLFGLLVSMAALMAPDRPVGGGEAEEKITRTSEPEENNPFAEPVTGTENREAQLPGEAVEGGSSPVSAGDAEEAITVNETATPEEEPVATVREVPEGAISDQPGEAGGEAGDPPVLYPAEPAIALRVVLSGNIPQTTPELSLRDNEIKIIPAITPDAMRKFLTRHEVFVNGGTVLRNSYTENSVKPGWSAGFGYRINFTDHLSASASVLYTVHQGIGLSTVSDSTFYNFGKEVIRTTRDVYRFDYFEFPLVFAYNLNAKHSFESGGYFGILNQVSQSVQTERYSIKEPVVTETRDIHGYDSDFARFDYGLSLGYWYRPLPQLSLGIELKQGLQDVTIGKAELFRSHHRNFSTRVGIRYTIF